MLYNLFAKTIITSKLSYEADLHHGQYFAGMLKVKQNTQAVQMSQDMKSKLFFLANQSLESGFMKGI